MSSSKFKMYSLLRLWSKTSNSITGWYVPDSQAPSVHLPAYTHHSPTPTPQPHPAQHAPPQHQQAEAPAASDTASQTPLPSASHHKSSVSHASCDTPHTASPPSPARHGTYP